MAETRERPASRGRSGGTKAKRSSANGSRSSAQTKSRNTRSRASASNGASQAKASTSRNGASKSSGVMSAAKSVAVPVATGVAGAVAGAAGGMVLGRRTRKPRKVLGVPIPGSRDGLSGLAKEVRKAGEQFGHLASEVQTTRKKAEDVGKAIS